MSSYGLIPYVYPDWFAKVYGRPAPVNPASLALPGYTSTSVLLSQEKERRKAQNRQGRRSTNLTGGLTGQPTLGAGSLFGL